MLKKLNNIYIPYDKITYSKIVQNISATYDLEPISTSNINYIHRGTYQEVTIQNIKNPWPEPVKFVSHSGCSSMDIYAYLINHSDLDASVKKQIKLLTTTKIETTIEYYVDDKKPLGTSTFSAIEHTAIKTVDGTVSDASKSVEALEKEEYLKAEQFLQEEYRQQKEKTCQPLQ